MEVRKTLIPGQHGTKGLVRQYGDQLICVRYRYDEASKRRFKTVELIVEDIPWVTPEDPGLQTFRPPRKVVNNVLIHVGFQEAELRQRVKNAGGRWMKDEKAWLINYQQARDLRLEHRIVKLVDENELPY